MTWTRCRRRCAQYAGIRATRDGPAGWNISPAPLVIVIAGMGQGTSDDQWVPSFSMVLAAIALAWLTTAFGVWAFGRRAGFYAGLCISTCFGLFLFTRILIPDVMLTASIALSMWRSSAPSMKWNRAALVGLCAGRQLRHQLVVQA